MRMPWSKIYKDKISQCQISHFLVFVLLVISPYFLNIIFVQTVEQR